MPGAPENPVLGGVEYNHPLLPQHSQGGVAQTEVDVPFRASTTVVYVPTLTNQQVNVPFRASTTVVWAPTLSVTNAFVSQEVAEVLLQGSAKALVSQEVTEVLIQNTTGVTRGGVSQVVVEVLVSRPAVHIPFLSSHTVVYPVILPVEPPFIHNTHVWSIFSIYLTNWTGSGPGNGGEVFGVELNSSGTTTTATLTNSIGIADTYLNMTGDSGMPQAHGFMVTIDSEKLYLIPSGGGGIYSIAMRGAGNTTAATHASNATISWTDSYDLSIAAGNEIDPSFTANINSTGNATYNGWLMSYDSTQAYELNGTRIPMHVTSFVGVFAAGAGTTGTNKVDASQPGVISAPVSDSDHCGAALSNPARVSSQINPGDVAVLRYTNPNASPMLLGPRSVAVQSWYGLKRVDATDNDVTLTNPNGICVDTKSGIGTYTGSVNTEPNEPLPSVTGIAPDASDAAGHAVNTPQPVPYLTTTLLGTNRYFTYGSPHYNEKGWPIGVLSVRQGNRRIPFWQSWDWHNFSYVYCGWGTDCSFAQVIINRNGMSGSLPTISLPGPQDITGPDAVWDDGTYYFGASWYVVLVATPYLVFGPGIGGTVPPGGGAGQGIPGVVFLNGSATINLPNPPEGGSGGGIVPPIGDLHVWHRA